MSTIEKLIAQIFERKNSIIEQVRHQVELYDQQLASKLIIQGIDPPDWLWSHEAASRSSNPSEIDKQRLISELLLPVPQLAVPNFSSLSIPEFNFGQQDEQVNLTCADVCEVENVASSPKQQAAISLDDCNNGIDLSCAEFTRSKSRQRAVEFRSSAKSGVSGNVQSGSISAVCYRYGTPGMKELPMSNFTEKPETGSYVNMHLDDNANCEGISTSCFMEHKVKDDFNNISVSTDPACSKVEVGAVFSGKVNKPVQSEDALKVVQEVVTESADIKIQSCNVYKSSGSMPIQDPHRGDSVAVFCKQINTSAMSLANLGIFHKGDFESGGIYIRRSNENYSSEGMSREGANVVEKGPSLSLNSLRDHPQTLELSNPKTSFFISDENSGMMKEQTEGHSQSEKHVGEYSSNQVNLESSLQKKSELIQVFLDRENDGGVSGESLSSYNPSQSHDPFLQSLEPEIPVNIIGSTKRESEDCFSRKHIINDCSGVKSSELHPSSCKHEVENILLEEPIVLITETEVSQLQSAKIRQSYLQMEDVDLEACGYPLLDGVLHDQDVKMGDQSVCRGVNSSASEDAYSVQDNTGAEENSRSEVAPSILIENIPSFSKILREAETESLRISSNEFIIATDDNMMTEKRSCFLEGNHLSLDAKATVNEEQCENEILSTESALKTESLRISSYEPVLATDDSMMTEKRSDCSYEKEKINKKQCEEEIQSIEGVLKMENEHIIATDINMITENIGDCSLEGNHLSLDVQNEEQCEDEILSTESALKTESHITGFEESAYVVAKYDGMTDADESMPVLQGFFMDSDCGESFSAGCQNDVKESWLPSSTLRRFSALERLCQSSSRNTPVSQFPLPNGLQKTSDLFQSVPTGFLEHISLAGDFNNLKLQQKSLSAGLPMSTGFHVSTPYASPFKKKWDHSTSSSGLSSGVSLNPELVCFTIEEDPGNCDDIRNHDEAAEAPPSHGSDLKNSSRRKPLADITHDGINLHPSVSVTKNDVHEVGQTPKFYFRSQVDSTATEADFTEAQTRTRQKLGKKLSNKKRRLNNAKDNRNINVGANGGKQVTDSLKEIESPKHVHSENLKTTRASDQQKVLRSNNIVSNMSSFIPLVQKKKAAAVITGKRDVKVKALEAAEAAKRLAEKKENERKAKKEAWKAEKARLEQDNLLQLELKKKMKEEELKKKEAEIAARKRIREEEDKKEKEGKRRRVEEARKQQHEQEKKQADKHIRHQADGLRIHKKDPNNGVEQNAKMEAGGGKCRVIAESGDKLTTVSSDTGARPHDLKDSNISMKADTGDSNLNMVVSDSIATAREDTKDKAEVLQSYDISPYQGSDDEDEDDEDDIRKHKFVPAWASKNSLAEAVFSQQHINPDEVLPPESFCSIAEVLIPRKLLAK